MYLYPLRHSQSLSYSRRHKVSTRKYLYRPICHEWIRGADVMWPDYVIKCVVTRDIAIIYDSV